MRPASYQNVVGMPAQFEGLCVRGKLVDAVVAEKEAALSHRVG